MRPVDWLDAVMLVVSVVFGLVAAAWVYAMNPIAVIVGALLVFSIYAALRGFKVGP